MPDDDPTSPADPNNDADIFEDIGEEIGDDFAFMGKRQWDDIVDGVSDALGDGVTDIGGDMSEEAGYDNGSGEYQDELIGDMASELQEEPSTGSSESVPVYSAPINYAVRKTGYYCIGALSLQPTSMASSY